jgi:hypothetical protein
MNHMAYWEKPAGGFCEAGGTLVIAREAYSSSGGDMPQLE